MDFSLSSEQEQLVQSVERLCAGFGDDYWLRLDTDGGFPHDFFDTLAGSGWLGICIPEAFGGSGLGIAEAALIVPMDETQASEASTALEGALGS